MCRRRTWSLACVAEDEDGGYSAYSAVHGHKLLVEKKLGVCRRSRRQRRVSPEKMMKAIGCSVRVEGGGRSGGHGGDGKRAAFAGDGHAEVARGRVMSGGRSGGCGDEDDGSCGNSGNDMSCLGGVCWNKHAMHGCVAGVCVLCVLAPCS